MRGAVYISAFGCGPDSYIRQYIKERLSAAGLPLLELTLDSHTAQAGLETRIEAFADMLRHNKQGGLCV